MYVLSHLTGKLSCVLTLEPPILNKSYEARSTHLTLKSRSKYLSFVAVLRSVQFTQKGLPAGLCLNPKSQFGKFLEGLEMESVGIYFRYSRLENFMAI
jgi:hypothetical protein